MNSKEKHILLLIKYIPMIVIFIVMSLILYIVYSNNKDFFEIYYKNFVYFNIFIIFSSLFFSLFISYFLKKIFLDYQNKIFETIEENKKRDLYIFQQSKLIAISELMKNISHHWRQNLSIISTISSGLKLKKEMGITNQKEEINFLDIIVQNTRILSKILDNFTDSYVLDFEKSIFSTSDLIDKVIKIINVQFENYEINIVKNINDFKVNGYKNQLIQVILNILNNSRDKFLKNNIESKVLKIETYENSKYFFITITNNSGNIERNELDKIFEPFSLTGNQSNGNDFELYISNQIISKIFNGRIIVRNEQLEYRNNLYEALKFEIKIPKKEADTF